MPLPLNLHRLVVRCLRGWTAYSRGALTMAALLRGLVPVNFWTEHASQLAALLEIAAWLRVRVLGLGMADVRRQAGRAQLARQALLALAHTHALTGLPNRRGLQQAMGTTLGLSRVDSVLAVFMLDLDGFKLSNDRLDPDAGVELLGAFELPFTVAGQACRVGLTIGFALAPHDRRDGGDLPKRADAAM